jgi:hypothetical protein
MPNESLALPELLAGLSDAADYDAVLAAVMATESGRRFLTEFAQRNRNADTAMVVGAIAKVEAAIRGEAAPPPAAVASVGAGELIEIAAALDRIATAIAVGAPRALHIAAAVERIQDIAFMLHERPLEATLPDSLDAAVRELAVAAASPDAAADTADLVHALARRVREMIDARMSRLPPAESFAVSPDGGEALAQAVAAFAATLPAFADAGAGEASAAPSVDEQKSETIPPPLQQDVSTALPAEPAPASAAAMPIEVAPVAEVDAAATPPQQAVPEILDSASILSQAFADDHFAGAPVTAEAPVGEVQPTEQTARDEPPRQELPRQELPSQELPRQELPAQELPPQEPPSEAPSPVQEAAAAPVVADLEEDPADLFAPEPVQATPAVESAAPIAESPQSEPPQVVPPPPARAIPRPPSSDPLAAVRELSEEELIALFS